MGRPKVLSHGLCLFDSKTEQRALQFLHIYCSDVRSHSSAPESNKQNPLERTLDLSIFFRNKHIPSLKSLPWPAPNENSPYWFQGNFVASFVLNFCLREFLLSAFANRIELMCEPAWLMLLYYKICPCLITVITADFLCFYEGFKLLGYEFQQEIEFQKERMSRNNKEKS